jgi:hypothetical protein
MALFGAHFEECGADWKVLDVRWCPATSSVVGGTSFKQWHL